MTLILVDDQSNRGASQLMVVNEEIVPQQSETNNVDTMMVTVDYYWQHLNNSSESLKSKKSNIFEFR